MLGLISRTDFDRRVKEFRADYKSKGVSSWNQLVSMRFCQMAQAKSLREICGGLKICLGKLVHLGVGRTPSKSNLSYANRNRPWELYEAVIYDLLKICRGAVPWNKRKFRFNDLKEKYPEFNLKVIYDLFQKVQKELEKKKADGDKAR